MSPIGGTPGERESDIVREEASWASENERTSHAGQNSRLKHDNRKIVTNHAHDRTSSSTEL